MRYRQRDGQATGHTLASLLSAALIAAGIGLRLWQFWGRSALWTDEAALANSIVGRPLGRLLSEPLAHNQAAPVGFLAIEKISVLAFGASELALRAYPVVCGILAVVLLWRLARRLLPANGMPLVLAPFACAPVVIFHAVEVKQYSSDVVIALALVLMALGLSDAERGARLDSRRALAVAVAGAAAVWFSQPAVLVVAGLAIALRLGRSRRASGSRSRRWR